MLQSKENKIRVLSDATINKIAAGEVIENPASVVKELVENALDAGAKKISVEVAGGGFQLIKVVDDGCGMDKDDAVLALERHATSKIREVEDLHHLDTMGFRGEALASIAAVSRLTLMTAVIPNVTENLDLGPSQSPGAERSQLACIPNTGDVETVPAAGAFASARNQIFSHVRYKEGTRVEIEGGKLIAVSPCARTQGTTIEVESLFYNVPARKKFQKSSAASNAEIHRVMSALSLAHPDVAFELKGVFSVPKQELKERIEEVLGVEFMKSAVKIEHEGIRGFVGAPKNARANRTGQYLFINRRMVISPTVSFAVKDGFGTQIDVDRYPLFVLHLEMPPHLVDVNVHPQKKEVRFQDEQGIRRVVKEAVASAFFGERPVIPSAVSVVEFMPSLKFREESAIFSEPWMLEEAPQPIGLWDHYLLFDAASIGGYEDGILMVDLWDAQERLTYEKLKEKGESQGLLVPLTIELLPEEVRHEELKRLGFSMHQIGKTAWAVEAIPPFLDEIEVSDAIRSVCHEENYDKMARIVSKRMRKKRFMLQEALVLWQKFFRLPNWNASARYLSRAKIDSMG